MGLCQQGEGVSGALGDAKPLSANDVQAHVQCRFACTLNIENGGILTAEVMGKPVGVNVIFLASSGHTPFDGGGFVDQDIICHTPLRCPSHLEAEVHAQHPDEVFR